MRRLTARAGNLLDLIDMPDAEYQAVKAAGTAGVTKPQIFPVLDEARRIVRSAAPGQNVLRYLMLRMHNQVLKPQYYREGCGRLSGLNLSGRSPAARTDQPLPSATTGAGLPRETSAACPSRRAALSPRTDQADLRRQTSQPLRRQEREESALGALDPLATQQMPSLSVINHRMTWRASTRRSGATARPRESERSRSISDDR